MTSSVDGLISGLSTSTIIGQLIQAESAPQQALKTKVQKIQTTQTALRSVNTRVAALQTAAHTLTLDSTWAAAKATSTSDAVLPIASSGATAGDFTFNITQLASARVAIAKVPASGPLVSPGGAQLSIGTGAPVDLGLTENSTAQQVADAINAKDLGVKASLVSTDQGTFLQLGATKTGLSNSFTVTGLVPSLTDTKPAADAKIQVGDPAHGGYTVSNSSNTFTGVLAGVTLSVNKLQDDVTVSVASDAGGIADKIQAMVAAANNALTEIGNQSAYNATTKVAGPLLSDLTTRATQQGVLSTVATGSVDYGSYKQYGVELDKSGHLTFDRAAFLAAYQKDPAATKAAVGKGLATDLDKLTKSATDPINGTITLAVQSSDSAIKGLNDQISGWDTRLKTRQDALQRQFSNLEVALGKMKDQSNWLAGQIAGLPSGK